MEGIPSERPRTIKDGTARPQSGRPTTSPSADPLGLAGELGIRLTAHRLQRDLHVNLAGAALAIELLEEIETLRVIDPESAE